MSAVRFFELFLLPGGTDACQGGQNGKAFLDYITWAIAENELLLGDNIATRTR